MNSQSPIFIKDTILKLLGAIGSEKEIKKYIEKYSSPEQRFAIIKVGGSVIQNDLDNLDENHSEKLFDQDTNDEEDFEIPAFLRKQKF